jgi:hypothetical protein
LLLQGSEYSINVTFDSNEYNNSGELVNADLETFVLSEGMITFNQISPLRITPSGAVPEPLTVLGVTTSVAFGALFKRKIGAKNKL